MRTSIFLVAAFVVSLATARAAEAKQVKFVGVHPIAAEYGGGFCYIEVPHIHIYEPRDAGVQYRVHDGAYFYVGDPVAYGYDGPKHAYYGPHPVQVNAIVEDDDPDVVYCYLEGPHYHYYQPVAEAKFAVKGGVYWYTGDFDPGYERDRPKFAHINVEMKPIHYARPVVVVAPPPEYRGPIVEVDGPEVVVPVVEAHDGVGVGGIIGVHASVGVVVPAPSVDIHLGVPGAVIIEEDEHHYKHHHDEGHHYGERKKGRW